MSGFLHDVAAASLPIAITLLLLGALARGVLASRTDDAELRELAAAYVGPFSLFCLVAAGVHLVGLLGSGDGGGLAIALGLAIAAGAVALRPTDATRAAAAVPAAAPAPAPAPEPVAEEAPDPAPAPVPGPLADGALWAGPVESSTHRRSALWSD
jgi:hypothetical protein